MSTLLLETSDCFWYNFTRQEHTNLAGLNYSLVPRPSLTAFFCSRGTLFSTAAKKAVREGLGTRLPQLHKMPHGLYP